MNHGDDEFESDNDVVIKMSFGSKMKLTDLPREVVIQIIFYVYSSGYSILPIIILNKQFFSNFKHLLYLTKIVSVTDDSNYKFTDEIFLPNVSILQISTKLLNGGDLNKNVRYVCDNLNRCNNLVILKIEVRSFRLLARLIQNLPINLKSLFIILKNRKKSFWREPDQSLYLDESNIHSQSIQTFHLVCDKEVVNNHLHPEIIGFSLRHDVQQQQEDSTFENVSSLKKINSFFTSYRSRSIGDCKLQFGKLINGLLSKNRSHLKYLKFHKFDTSLVMMIESMTLPHLRLLEFDNSSRLILNKWLKDFQNVNAEGFNGMMVLYDDLGEVVYYKRIKSTEESGIGGELGSWALTKDVNFVKRFKQLNSIVY